MASNLTEGAARPSFAKIAAMSPASKELTPISQASLVTASPPASHISLLTRSNPDISDSLGGLQEQESTDDLSKTVQSLSLLERKEGGGGELDAGNDSISKNDGAFDDSQTHLSNSSTKPTSFDSKSMASVTAFAMDEKESLRPDDSASVQAAEEDDAFSVSLSGAPNSQVSSAAGARFMRAQDGLSQPIPGLPSAGTRFHDGDLPARVSPGEHVLKFQGERALHGFPNEPDEKLLEALESPKDRLMLLQLEDKIITFIKNTSEQSLELPPCNAFGRLLAHKLGDYYHLTHFVDNATSVRLHRTPWSRVPTPLSLLQPITNKTPPPNAPAMKIMRRMGHAGEKASVGGSTAPSSSAPSKATSENGGENSNDDAGSSAAATPAKDRASMTREEREAKYQEARERIFRDFPESKSSDSPKSGEQSTNISRSSSKNGRKKGHRQKTPLDDGFEARSQYNAYYYGTAYSGGTQFAYNGTMQVHDGSFNSPTDYMMVPAANANYSHPGVMNPTYPQQGNLGGGPQYPFNAQPLPNQWQQSGSMQHSPAMSGYPSPTQVHLMPQQQVQMRSAPNVNPYMPSAGQFMPSQPAWGQPAYQQSFQSPMAQRPTAQVPWSHGPPQGTPPTGQMQYNNYGQSPGRMIGQTSALNTGQQHPGPGSYSRPQFNPQSRSFAPAGNSHARYSEYSTGPQQAPNSQFGNVPVWQGNQDNSAHSSWNQSPAQSTNGRNTQSLSPNSGLAHGRPGDHQDSISKWGTPAHLPPKPPPSEVSHPFDTLGRAPNAPPKQFANNPPTIQPQTGPLVVSGSMGRQKPHIQGNSATGM